MIKWPIYQNDITIIGINASNNKATKYMKQYLIKSNREIDNSTIIIGRFSRETVVSAGIFVWEEAAPPALALKSAGLASPHVSLPPFGLLPQHWGSKRVTLSVRLM